MKQRFFGVAPEQWIDGQRTVDAFGAVSFFDSGCAAVHVRQNNDIAFTPYGLDVLPKLGETCKAVQKQIDAKKHQYEGLTPQFLKSKHVAGSTSVGRVLQSLRHTSDIDAIEALASLTDEEVQQLKSLPQQLANDPAKVAKDLRGRLLKLENLQSKIKKAAGALSDESIAKLCAAATDANAKKLAAEAAAAKSDFLGDGSLQIGSSEWRVLGNAAINYSKTVFPGEEYPVTEPADAVCVLCQQPFADDAKKRMQRFESFVKDDTAVQAETAAKALKSAVAALNAIGLNDEIIADLLAEVAEVNADAANDVKATIESMLAQIGVIQAAHIAADWSTVKAEQGSVADQIDGAVATVQARITEVELSADPEARKLLEQTLAELQAREWLMAGDSSW